MLPEAFDPELAAILGAKAREVACALLAVGCADDHIHVLVRLAPKTALADLVQRLKGASAFDVNQRVLLPARLVWQDGYWAESVTPAELEPLALYILQQRHHHDDLHPAEGWQRTADGEPALPGGL